MFGGGWLIIGDVHHKVAEAERLIARHGGWGTKVLFLGDYFDTWGDGPAQAAKTAAWLAESVRKRDRVHLVGNHDLPYLFPDVPLLRCPGFSEEKRLAALPQLDTVRERLRLAHAEDGWLCSHAGVHDGLFSAGEPLPSPEAIADLANGYFARLPEVPWPEIFGVGAARGGKQACGGLTWQDWNVEFRPLPGLNQIVGHTPRLGCARARCWLRGKGLWTTAVEAPATAPQPPLPPAGEVKSENWCLDTLLALAARLRKGRLEFVALD